MVIDEGPFSEQGGTRVTHIVGIYSMNGDFGGVKCSILDVNSFSLTAAVP
jgi:hypothetical protein